MVYGVHVYARAKVVPDLELSRGKDAYRAARVLGDRSIEFLAAGGVALGLPRAGRGRRRRSGGSIVRRPSRPRPRREPCPPARVVAWHGPSRGGRLDRDARAPRAGGDHGDGPRASARCEALARLALDAPVASRSAAAERRTTSSSSSPSGPRRSEGARRSCPGMRPWGAQAHAALATVALARGDIAARLAARRVARPCSATRPGSRGCQPGDRHSGRADPCWPAPPEVQASLRSSSSWRCPDRAAARPTRALASGGHGPLGRELVALAGPMGAPLPGEAAPELRARTTGAVCASIRPGTIRPSRRAPSNGR